MTPRRFALAAVALTAALALAACAPAVRPAGDASVRSDRPALSDVVALDDPASFVGPSSAVLSDAAIEPVADDPARELPVVVTSRDLTGPVEVTVTDTSRVIALDLSGSLAATVWGLGFGDALVGRDVSTTFPGTEDLPVVTGSGHTVNLEAIIALKPTLVITDGSIGPVDVVQQLRDVGVSVVFVDRSSSFAGAAELARQVADVLGAPDAGVLLAQRIADDVDRVRAEIDTLAPEERLRVVFLYLRGSAGVFYLFGEESGADDLIDGLAGVDVAAELGWRGMQPLTDEAMVAADPDVILVMTGGLESVGGVDGLLADKPAIALTAAGQHRRFVDMADGQILSFGPRSAAVLDALARAVYAPEPAP